MPIEIGDSTATVRSKINAVLTDAGLDPADNVDTTAATTLLNQVAGLWDVDVEFVDRMPEAEFRAAFTLLEGGGGLAKTLPGWDAYLRGERNFVVLVAGSSTPRGQNSGNGSTNMYTNGWSNKVSDFLNAYGQKARNDAFFGSGSADNITNIATRDPRIILTGNWYTDAIIAAGGYRLRSTAAARVDFTPQLPFDRITPYYQTFTSPGSSLIGVDGGAPLGTIDRNTGAETLGRQTFSVPLGNHTINLAWASGSFGLVGIRPTRSDRSEVEFINLAAGGSDFTQAAYDPSNASPIITPNAITALGPVDLFIMATGRNEWANGSSISAMKSRMQTMGERAETVGAKVLIVTPFQEALYATNNGAAYVQAQRDLAAEKGWWLHDDTQFFGPYDPDDGTQSGDSIHKNDYWHGLMANRFYSRFFR